MGKDDGIESLRRRRLASALGPPARVEEQVSARRALKAELPARAAAPPANGSGGVVHVAVGPGASSTRSQVSQVRPRKAKTALSIALEKWQKELRACYVPVTHAQIVTRQQVIRALL